MLHESDTVELLVAVGGYPADVPLVEVTPDQVRVLSRAAGSARAA